MSSKPLLRMKFSSDLSPLDASCSAVHGRLLVPCWSNDQESRSLLKTAPPATVLSGGASWCLESTTMAAFKFSRACTLSFSMPWNSEICFSRSAVASAKAVLSEAICSPNSLMVVASSVLRAVRRSMSEPSCSIFAVDALIASSFSYLPVLHQHSSSLKSASSSSWSFSSVADISFNKFTTRVIGVSLPLSKDFSQTRCKEPPAEPAAEPAAAAPASKVPKTTMCNMVLAS
mmetsp:Transcript_20630/g.71378  ORF Transcript_20630/g.71378 Transcript_20630/m.71378 type:complete len:231 (+) Transcript_20630:1614-2306(+)